MFILSYYNTFFTKKTTDCSLYVGFIARLVFCIWLRRTKRHGKNALTKQQRKSTHPSRQSLRFVPRHLPCQGKAFYMENNPLSRLSATAPLVKGSLWAVGFSQTASGSKHSFSPLCAKGSLQDCCCGLRRRVRSLSKGSLWVKKRRYSCD